MAGFILVDVSNTFTKVALATRQRVRRVTRFSTPSLSAAALRRLLRGTDASFAVVASVVPGKNRLLASVLPQPICWVGPDIDLGIGIDYPKPETIGADRLANAVACAELYRVPSVVVDLGTAVTFDVLSSRGAYVGGVIAPGLRIMTDYMHDRTALLPEIRLAKPRRAVGRTTREAMLAGTVHGCRGMVREILHQIRQEQFAGQKPKIVATGGDARLIGAEPGFFDIIDPQLTLEGLRLIGNRNAPV